MPMHPRAQPNFRNLVIRPLWMSMKTALRTFPFVGKYFRNEYHNKPATLLDENSKLRVQENKYNTPANQEYTADRESSDLFPSIYRPVTIMYPYERLEDMEPWLFVPGEYNGRIGVIWETCTACRLCVTICPNDCLHMTTELRVDVMETKDGEDSGLGKDLEVGGWAAMPIKSGKKENEEYDIFMNAYDGKPSSKWGDMWHFNKISFAELANNMGAFGIRVTDPAEIQNAIKLAIKSNKPSIIEIDGDVNALAPTAWTKS